jgi:hypothetical protein
MVQNALERECREAEVQRNWSGGYDGKLNQLLETECVMQDLNQT